MQNQRASFWPPAAKTMRLSSPAMIFLLAGVLSGCYGVNERLQAVRPGRGVVRIFEKPYELVYSATFRAMHNLKLNVRKANPERGRIVALSTFTTLAVFITKMADGRTRVEVDSTDILNAPGFQTFGEAPKSLFAELDRQIPAFEKARAIRKESPPQ